MHLFALESGLIGAIAMLSGVLLLDLYDITLPHGDSVSMTGPLVAAAVIIEGAPVAFGVAITGLLLSWIIVRPKQGPLWLGVALLTRVVSAAAVWLITSVVGTMAPGALVALIAPITYLTVELSLQQMAHSLESGRPFVGLVRGSVGRQGAVVAAEVSASVLLIVTFPGMGPWSLIPVVALLLLIRQSWAMLLRIRDTYRTTTTVLVDAAVAQNPELEGHAERTAMIARSIAARLGLSPKSIERLGYAALLHDIDCMNDPLSQEEIGVSLMVHSASAVVKDVDFLRDVIPVLRVADGLASPDEVDDETLLMGLIILMASFADTNSHSLARRAGDVELVDAVSRMVPRRYKARAAAAALDLGYQLPAIA